MDDTEAAIHLAGTVQPRRPNTSRTANLERVERLLDALSTPARFRRRREVRSPGDQVP
jgi:hypothetical protein